MPDQLLLVQTVSPTSHPDGRNEHRHQNLNSLEIFVTEEGNLLTLEYFTGRYARFEGLSGYFSYPYRDHIVHNIGLDGEVVASALYGYGDYGGTISRNSQEAEFQINAEGDPFIYLRTISSYYPRSETYNVTFTYAVQEDGQISEAVSLLSDFSEFNFVGYQAEIGDDGTSVFFARSYDLQDERGRGLPVFTVLDADGNQVGEPVPISSFVTSGDPRGARVNQDGNIVVRVGDQNMTTYDYVADLEGNLIARHTVLTARGGPSDPSIGRDGGFLRLPDGGYVRAGVQNSSAGQSLVLQHHDAEGRPNGSPIQFLPTARFGGVELAIGEGGHLWAHWIGGASPLDTEGSGRYNAGFQVITPRDLTDGDDLEYLAEGEAVNGGAGDDVLIGTTGVERLLGGDGDDILIGGEGDDLFRGGAGNDVILGGAGDSDTAFFQGNWSDYTFRSTDEFIYVSGIGAAAQDGEDRLSGIERLVFADLATDVTDFFAQYGDGFDGTEGDDAFYGDSGDNVLSGLAGDDTLSGGDGRDTLNGGGGDDHLTGGTRDTDLRDMIFGGAGNDILLGGYGNDHLSGDDGNDTLGGGAGADTVAGGEGDDQVTGDALSDVLFGGIGDDFLNGGFGFDRLNGGAGADRFFHIGLGSHGSDWIQDFSDEDGDLLMFGTSATAADFLVQRANTPGAGSADIDEIFVMHRASGHIFWALVDGGALDSLSVLAVGEVFELF